MPQYTEDDLEQLRRGFDPERVNIYRNKAGEEYETTGANILSLDRLLHFEQRSPSLFAEYIQGREAEYAAFKKWVGDEDTNHLIGMVHDPIYAAAQLGKMSEAARDITPSEFDQLHGAKPFGILTSAGVQCVACGFPRVIVMQRRSGLVCPACANVTSLDTHASAGE